MFLKSSTQMNLHWHFLKLISNLFVQTSGKSEKPNKMGEKHLQGLVYTFLTSSGRRNALFS